MRVDLFLSENNYFDSRNKAKEAILRGEVFINGRKIDKVSINLEENIEYKVEIKAQKSFVSLGGYKLDKGLNDFNLSVNNFTCLDVGASTGGFTDCLLQNGAKKVYAIDLNDSLLHNKLKDDKRVIPIIKNAKLLNREDFGEDVLNIDLITADLSFISETVVMPVFSSLLQNGKLFMALIKPQFENDAKIKFKNGIIRDKKYQISSIEKIFNCGIKNELTPINLTTASINNDKNIEFLMLFQKGASKAFDISKFDY